MPRSWILAIDFGTSYSVAAALSEDDAPRVLEIDGHLRFPSVILVDDERVIVGRVADEMASARPADVLRTPKSRLGDQAPVILGGRTFQIVPLVGALLQGIYRDAIRQLGSPPSHARLTYPATWTRTRQARLLEAAGLAGFPQTMLVAEPVAAALSYWHRGELPTGGYVAVYDLGGGTFDSAVLQATDDGFRVVGRPDGDPSLGGELFDELVVNLIGEQLDEQVWERVQLGDDPAWRQAATVLRKEARRAKETLSNYPYTDVLVSLPTGFTSVRVQRDAFEAAIAPYIEDSIELFRRCIQEAGVGLDRITAIQLVGGSSRIPAVEGSLRAAFPALDIHRRGDPKTTVALGALLAPEASVTPTPVDFGSSEDARISPVHLPLITDPGAARPATADQQTPAEAWTVAAQSQPSGSHLPPVQPPPLSQPPVGAVPSGPAAAAFPAPQTTFAGAGGFSPPPPGGPPPGVSGRLPNGQPPRPRRRRPAVIASVVTVLLALIAGIALIVTRGGDDSTASDETDEPRETDADEADETTAVATSEPGGSGSVATEVATTETSTATTAVTQETLSSGPAVVTTTTVAEAPRTGGSVRIGVSAEWLCMDWMGTCANSTYGDWSARYFTTARPFDIARGDDGLYHFVASNLLTGEPTVTSDGTTQVVTYSINPEARWSDGTPITSADFRYTWDQVVNGADVFDTSVFSDVASVDDSNPTVAVLTFTTINASWKNLFQFSGLYPSHLLTGKDRATETANGYFWSAGPFMLEQWQPGVGASFVVNPNYWGPMPRIDRIEETFFSDSAAELNSFRAGEVDTIAPGVVPDVVAEFATTGFTGTTLVDSGTGSVEALWLNNAAAPFEEVAVRQAVGYSLDRDAIASATFGEVGISNATNSLVPPIAAAFGDVAAFGGYTPNPDMVVQLLSGAGYAKGGDGYWSRGGVRLSFTVKSTAGNARREAIEQLMQTQLAASGIEMLIDNRDASDLFFTDLPTGDFQAALFIQVFTSVNPSLGAIFASSNIPSEANGFVGSNYTGTNLPDLDAQLTILDRELDETLRSEAGAAAEQIMAANAVSFPLNSFPNLAVYGPNVQGDFSINPASGPWWNIATWSIG